MMVHTTTMAIQSKALGLWRSRRRRWTRNGVSIANSLPNAQFAIYSIARVLRACLLYRICQHSVMECKSPSRRRSNSGTNTQLIRAGSLSPKRAKPRQTCRIATSQVSRPFVRAKALARETKMAKAEKGLAKANLAAMHSQVVVAMATDRF